MTGEKDSTTPGGTSFVKDIEKAVLSNFTNIGQIMVKMDSAASQMLKQFGQGQEMAELLRASMSDSVTSVRRLGGDIADVLAVQKDASKELGRNVVLTEETTKDLYATMKVTGQETSKIVGGMADAGIGAGKAADEMLKVVNVARESGVNAQAVSKTVLDNMQALNKYNFAGGVEGLAKMAAQATSLRIDMSQTLGFAEKVFNPEGAIEVAAAMQRLGVSQSSLLDPLKLMDLSQNDPAELQNQIVQMSKQFVQLGKDGHFEIMPGAKRQLREISKAMDIPYDQLTKMALGSADLDKKMKEISFPSATEDQKKMIANMAEMGKGGTYEIKTAEGKTKDVSELTGPEIEALEKMANTAPPTMEELAKQQLTATEAITAAINSLGDRTGLGIAGSKIGTGLYNTGKQVAKGIEKLPAEGLESKNIRSNLNQLSDSVMGALKDYANTGQESSKLSEAFSDFGNYIKKDVKDSFVNLKDQASKFTTENPLMSALMDAGKVVMGAPPKNAEIPRGGVGTNSMNGTQTSTQASTQKSTMDVNLNHTINITSPSGIDTKSLQDSLNNTDVKNKIVKIVQDTLSDTISRPIPSKNEPR